MNALVVEICMGTSCHLLGAQDLINTIEALPSAKRKRVDLRGQSCLGSCRRGPSVRINGVVLTGMTPERLLDIIDDNFPEY